MENKVPDRTRSATTLLISIGILLSTDGAIAQQSPAPAME